MPKAATKLVMKIENDRRKVNTAELSTFYIKS